MPASSPAVRPFELPVTRAAKSTGGRLLLGTPSGVAELARLHQGLAEASGSSVIGSVVVSPSSHAIAERSSVPILGTLADLPTVVQTMAPDLVVVSRAGLSPVELQRIQTIASELGVHLHVVPALSELLMPSEASTGASATHQFTRPAPLIDLGTLIGRTPYELDSAAVAQVLTGKRVLITGAGGSIGSELARVAAGFDPELLILMERSENALFEIDRQTAQRFPGVARKAILHDVVDAEATHRLLNELRPHAVFHAAAHKHVPLMEDHPGHAITNNLFGTKSIADAAIACRAERFVMISSDKAVNPSSVMGATKRLAEIYVRGIQPRAAGAGTRLSMVRFGNVLGSAASVLTIWSQQIAEGGPVTVTDPRMTRYFMTIPEAATLVIQSTTLTPAAQGQGEGVGVYVLNMGESIRVADLAARFIRAHGLIPRMPDEPRASANAIDIVFTGIRPGEKLYEELAYAAESLAPTTHPGIRAWAGPGFSQTAAAGVDRMVAELSAARFCADRGAMVDAIRRFVPEMR